MRLKDLAPIAIPWRMLRDLELSRRVKKALAAGLCPTCGSVLRVLDTWERACPCGYRFDYYHTPLITAPLPPEGQEATE